jgi:hypothetical protein
MSIRFKQNGRFVTFVSGVQMKFWAGKALKSVNCFAFLKCKLTVVIRAC